MSKYEKIKIFLLGILVAFMFMFLLGASGCSGGGGGRYQMSTLGTQYSRAIFVLDTTTGVISYFPPQTLKHCVYYPEEFPLYKFRELVK